MVKKKRSLHAWLLMVSMNRKDALKGDLLAWGNASLLKQNIFFHIVSDESLATHTSAEGSCMLENTKKFPHPLSITHFVT